MGKALYRKHRSRSFAEVVGQLHVTELLARAIEQKKISHAYLLTGPRGTGKTSVARIVAHAVNNLEYSDDPHLDIIEIDAASNRRIDDIRDLREKVHIAPVSAPYKVYIIDEVHMLTGESFNALLKTLEEPPAHVIFILATTEVHKLPATIISRAQRFHFRPASTKDIVEHLTSIATKESITVTPEALELIAQHANGGFRDSLSLLDQLSGLGEAITPELVESVLGMANSTSVASILQAVEKGDTASLITEIESQLSAGVSPVTLCEQLSRQLTVAAKSNHSLYDLLDKLSEVPRAYDPTLKLITTLVSASNPPKDAPKRTVAAAVSVKSMAKKPQDLRAQSVKPSPAAEPLTTALQPPSRSEPRSDKSFSWDGTLEIVKKHYPPLYSVLTRADVKYDEATQTLTMVFHYALHRKKLENAVYRNQLAAVISNLYGFEPELVITDTKAAAPMDEEANAIAAIMGGGELVSGAI